MSCPSWSHLVAHRHAGPDATEPEGWREALEHLESCAACREAAYAADPTLAFARAEPVRFDADEVSRMRAGVEALRRARRVDESSPASGAPVRRTVDREKIRWSALAPGLTRLAAAAGLAAILLSVHPHAGRTTGDPSSTTHGSLSLEALIAELQEIQEGQDPALESWGSDMAATDDFYRSTATVYQFDVDDLDLVMLVDSELEI